MAINQIFFFLLLFSVKFQLIAQNISGVVKDGNGNLLPFVSILIKENEDSEKILFFTRTDNAGKFIFNKEDILSNNDSI